MLLITYHIPSPIKINTIIDNINHRVNYNIFFQICQSGLNKIRTNNIYRYDIATYKKSYKTFTQALSFFTFCIKFLQAV